ncbi:hypothetical protein [Bradyrhizobium yuanmingense]|uniref:hypothetical protein n=1 Tax=Bradyrhizobium yuanmingense TaxID=108015 RepID=UPI0023B9EFC8|nr:hypothetical protein [Bradyrhizobium yuanmingense]MDF0498862.1 hypothetical protein [Bradyrhizobium yuanmingense]
MIFYDLIGIFVPGPIADEVRISIYRRGEVLEEGFEVVEVGLVIGVAHVDYRELVGLASRLVMRPGVAPDAGAFNLETNSSATRELKSLSPSAVATRMNSSSDSPIFVSSKRLT